MPEFQAGEHPSDEQLAEFDRGRIDGPLADAIERHLAACEACLSQFDGPGTSDSWVALIRKAGRGAKPAESRPLPAPGYELEGILGRGGMGVVHRARHVGLDRRVALKMIAAGRDASPMQVDRFRREVEAVARLSHPGIVPIYDVGVRDGVPFYTMELLDGGSLAERLAGKPLPLAEATALLEGLARAVDHAHRQGIVHRDLKPSNILFGADGHARVADFGLAKRLDADPDDATRSSFLLGTPSYMAPEQASGRPGEVGPSADIHALGAILFECLTGRPPFLAPTPLETLERIRTAEPLSPSQLRAGLPTDLATICLTCLDKDPARRYASAVALAEDLRRYSLGEPIRARPTGPLLRLAKWARRRPAEAGLIVLVALAMAGTIAGLLAHQARLNAALDREAEAAREARRQRGVAESNYRNAREAITRILASLSDPRYAGIPGMTSLRRSQAESALEFYEQALGEDDSADPVVRRDTAGAAVEAANLQIALGRADQAEPILLRAGRLYEGLLEGDPDDAALLRELMTCRIKLGVLLMGRDPRRSVEALEAARALARRRVDHPGDGQRPPGLDLAWCEHNLGSARQLAGDPAAAIPHYDRAIALYEGVRGSGPGDVALDVELAESLINAGLARSQTGSPVAAEEYYRRADSLLEAAILARPGDQHFLVTRCDLAVNLGNLEAALGRPESALECFDVGLRDIAPLLRLAPDLERIRSTALNLHGARASALEAAGRHGEAVPDWDRVLELDGGRPEATGYRLRRLLCLARVGDFGAVAEGASAMEEAEGLAAADRYNLACALSLASAAAPEGLLRDDLKARARESLDRAFLRDPGLRENAKDDADLLPLRPSPAPH
ncbi:MAG: serine/threonine-protein kinase [Isosphaeraceae bacterium]